jgi:hypothetical protein
MTIVSKLVAGAKLVDRNSALIKAGVGGALAVGGAFLIGKAMLQTPDAQKNSKYKGDLQFPLDLVDSSSDRNFFMTIQFMEYQRRSIFNQPFLQAIGGIRLPIPNNLVDTTKVTYGEEGSDSAQGAGIEAGLKGGNAQGGGGGFVGGLASAAAGALAGKAVSTAANLASGLTGVSTGQGLQLGGLAQNPFLTVLFKSPTFKRHSFKWRLMPNNQQESDIIKNIIETFRSNMLPAMAPSAGGTLLTYPNMAQISLYPNESYLYKFKPCVIESMSVNFAAAGSPSFFKGSNAPTAVEISIDFLEIEYWLKEDVENTSFRAQGAVF